MTRVDVLLIVLAFASMTNTFSTIVVSKSVTRLATRVASLERR